MVFSKNQATLKVLESTSLHEDPPIMFSIHLLYLRLNIFPLIIDLKVEIHLILEQPTVPYINKYYRQ